MNQKRYQVEKQGQEEDELKDYSPSQVAASDPPSDDEQDENEDPQVKVKWVHQAVQAVEVKEWQEEEEVNEVMDQKR